MELKQVKLDPFPTKLNVEDPDRNLLIDECVKNTNLIKLASGDVRAHCKFDTTDVWVPYPRFFKKVVAAYYLRQTGSDDRLLVYGIIDNGEGVEEGFLASFKKGIPTMEFGPFSSGNLRIDFVPVFVEYMDRVYALGVGKYFDSVLGWKDVMEHPHTFGCGTEHQGRMFCGGIQGQSSEPHREPGTLVYTEPGSFIIHADNWQEIGLIKEPITALVSVTNGVLVFKESGVWRLSYTSLAGDAKDAVVQQLSKTAGALSQHTIRKKHDIVYSYNKRGAYIIGREAVRAAPDKSLQIDPGIIEISRPVRKLFEEMFTETAYATNEDFHRESEPDVTWQYTDFQYYQHIYIKTTSGYEQGYGKGVNPTGEGGIPWGGWCRTIKIQCPPGYKIAKILAHGVAGMGPFDSIQPSYRDWLELKFGANTVPISKNEMIGEIRHLTWDENIGKQVGWGDDCQVDIHLYNGHFTPDNIVALKNLTIISEKIDTRLVGAGLHKDMFYIFGKSLGTGREIKYKDQSLGVGDGWLKVDNDEYLIYNLLESPLPWTDTHDIVGVGKNNSTQRGCLILKPIPDQENQSLTVLSKTGKLDFGAAEYPKKLRKIFITYKCNEPVTFSIYDDNGYVYTKTLEVSESFINKELNFNTNRSTWYQFEIATNGADFILRDCSIVLKVFKANE